MATTFKTIPSDADTATMIQLLGWDQTYSGMSSDDTIGPIDTVNLHESCDPLKAFTARALTIVGTGIARIPIDSMDASSRSIQSLRSK